MLILDEKGLSGIVKRFLDLIYIGGIAITLTLPISLKWYLDFILSGIGEGYFMTGRRERYYFLLVFLFITGVLALIIVNEIRKIFKTLNKKNPFIMDNAISLKRVAVSSFLISFAYVIKIIFYNSFFTIIIAMIFVIAGLFSIILAEVFRQAAVVKQENDLTI
jgi:hypothetical protein